MKKAVIAVMVVIMMLTAAFMISGCTDEAMQAQIDSLVDRVEDLENKNNVFWTDKAEYAEDETMTIYYNQTAVYKIRLYFINGFAFETLDTDGMNGSIYATSLVCDMRSDAVILTSYVEWENGIATRRESTSPFILRQNQEEAVHGVFDSKDDVTSGESYDYVICVPGTPFELARFVDVSMEK